MTKSELIARLAQRYPQLVAKDAEYAVKMILDAMTAGAARGQSHRDPRLRQLRAELPAAAHGRNPKSGEKVQVPEKYVPHFKAGKELRERVDQATEAGRGRRAAARLAARPLRRMRTGGMRIVTWTIRLAGVRAAGRASRRRTPTRSRCASTSTSRCRRR